MSGPQTWKIDPNVQIVGKDFSGCYVGNDGFTYNTSGYRIETNAERKARERKEYQDAEYAEHKRAEDARAAAEAEIRITRLENAMYDAFIGGIKSTAKSTIKVSKGLIAHVAKKDITKYLSLQVIQILQLRTVLYQAWECVWCL